jgi:hypothetical protein
VLGPSIANLAGGNMQGSCEPPELGQIEITYLTCGSLTMFPDLFSANSSIKF